MSYLQHFSLYPHVGWPNAQHIPTLRRTQVSYLYHIYPSCTPSISWFWLILADIGILSLIHQKRLKPRSQRISGDTSPSSIIKSHSIRFSEILLKYIKVKSRMLVVSIWFYELYRGFHKWGYPVTPFIIHSNGIFPWSKLSICGVSPWMETPICTSLPIKVQGAAKGWAAAPSAPSRPRTPRSAPPGPARPAAQRGMGGRGRGKRSGPSWGHVSHEMWIHPIPIRYDMIWNEIIWYDMKWNNMIWYDMIWYEIIRYDMIWNNTIWYDMK